MIKRLVIFSIGLILAVSAAVLLTNRSSSATVTASDWEAGNIINDSLFYDGDVMSVNEIQSFLNSLVPTCDTWGTKPHETISGKTRAQVGTEYGNPPPYICVKDYYENPTTKATNFNPTATIPAGAQSAAQIIYDAAKEYRINPKVLLVTIKKEAANNLLQDDWPWIGQYRSALGFGCPDTAACDSQYYGFYNQVRNAARQFRLYADYPNSYRRKAGTTYSIQYHPYNSCASPDVYIQNQATAGLYNYTPYQPNSAALANMPGAGDSCSSYGNRNFWYIWSNWFGSTQTNRWQPMLKPRVMIVKETTVKIYADTRQLDDTQLTTGQQIKFTSKTELSDGTICVRTELDTINKKSRCVILSQLSDFTPIYTDIDEVKAVNQATCKVDLRRSEAICSSDTLKMNQQLKLVAKTTVLGTDYYVVDSDWIDNDSTYGIRADRLRTSYVYTDTPIMYKKTNRVTNKISHIDSWTLDQRLESGMIISLSQSVLISGITYYRTTYDTQNNIDRVILSERLSPVFNPFIYPRNLKAVRETVSEDPITGRVCALVPSGTILFFNYKADIGNTSYFRTKTMTNIDSMCSIKAKDLTEI